MKKWVAECTFLLALFFAPAILPAQSGVVSEDNIIISSSVEVYKYDFNKASKSVEIKGEITNKYTCRNYRERGFFYDFFDDQSTLDAVELYEGGEKSIVSTTLKDYSVEDIFYSDAKVYNLELTFPKKDWKNEVRMKKTIKDPRYFCTLYFHESYSVEEKVISIIIPRWVNAEIVEFNFEGFDVTQQKTFLEKENADLVSYTIKNLPARKAEVRQPGSSYVLPHIMILSKSAEVNNQTFTYFKTLADQYSWYKKMVGLCKNDATVIKAKAVELTAGSATELDKVKAILYWVHENIRYVAFEDGIAGFKPDEAQHVLNKKYGDCKGMANLIKELLSAVGFDAHLAWIGTNHIRYDYSTPSLCVDNHMICYLELKGKKYFLDGTERYLPLGTYAERIQGRQVLVENGDTYKLEKIPATSFEQNLCQFKENLRIENNALSGEIEYLYRGESKQQLLSNIHSSKKEKLDAQLERYITNNNKNYLISDLKTSDVDKVDGELSLRFKATNAGAVSSFGNDMYIDIDYNKSFNQMIFDSTRKFDYCFSYKHFYRTETTLQLPVGYKVSSVPTDFDFNHNDFIFSIRFENKDGSIRYTKQLQVLNSFLKKRSFKEWNDAVERLSSKYLDQLILTKI